MFFNLWFLFPQSPSSSFSRIGKSMAWILLISLIFILLSLAPLDSLSPRRSLQSRVPTPPTSQNAGSKVGHAGSAPKGTVTVRAWWREACTASSSDLQSWILNLTFSNFLAWSSSTHFLRLLLASTKTLSKAVNPAFCYQVPDKDS